MAKRKTAALGFEFCCSRREKKPSPFYIHFRRRGRWAQCFGSRKLKGRLLKRLIKRLKERLLQRLIQRLISCIRETSILDFYSSFLYLRFESLAKQEQDLAGEVANWIPQVQKAVAGLAMEKSEDKENERHLGKEARKAITKDIKEDIYKNSIYKLKMKWFKCAFKMKNRWRMRRTGARKAAKRTITRPGSNVWRDLRFDSGFRRVRGGYASYHAAVESPRKEERQLIWVIRALLRMCKHV